jgi:hypothetical protein
MNEGARIENTRCAQERTEAQLDRIIKRLDHVIALLEARQRAIDLPPILLSGETAPDVIAEQMIGQIVGRGLV